MEYWDVTTWLDSGHRVLIRFLVTNQGPGVRTAAAVGHVVHPDGAIAPFKWGRLDGAWTLAADGRRLEIGKADLDITVPHAVVDVDANKQGVKLHLEIAHVGDVVALRPLPGEYSVDVAMPARVIGRVWTRGMEAPRDVRGTGIVTHACMERPEGELLRERIEAAAAGDDGSMYLTMVTAGDGRRDGTMIASLRDGAEFALFHNVTVSFDGALPVGGDLRYPVAARWKVRGAGLDARVAVRRELLRWNPLEILPEPFAALLALWGRPQRVWTDADVTLTVDDELSPFDARMTGIATASFARPRPTAE